MRELKAKIEEHQSLLNSDSENIALENDALMQAQHEENPTYSQPRAFNPGIPFCRN